MSPTPALQEHTMADITEIITSAVEEAGGEGEGAEVDATEATTGGDTAEGTTGEVEGATAPPEPDEFDKELIALGYKDPKNNRIPYRNVRRINENLRTKLEKEHKAALEEREQKLKTFESEFERIRATEELIANDPEKFLGWLAAIHPDKYRRYVANGGAPEAKPETKVDAEPEEPGPDVKYEDGTVGYSPQQLTKLMKWNRDQAKHQAIQEVTAQFEKRFGPIEQRWKSDRYVEQKMPVIRNQIAGMREVWGDLLDKHEADIIKYMDANPRVTFEAAVNRVLVPKMQADRNKIREEVLGELKARPEGSSKTAGGPAKPVGTTDGPRSIEDVIRESIAGMK